MQIGILKGKGWKRRLILLKTLAIKGPLSLTEISKEIAINEKCFEKWRKIRGRIGSKDGAIRRLHEKEYISGITELGNYERTEIFITYKGIYAILLSIEKNIIFSYTDCVEIDPRILSEIKNPIVNYSIVGFFMNLDYFYLFIKQIVPIKPTAIAWIEKASNIYTKKDLDEIYLEIIKNDLIESMEKIMNIIIYMMRSDGVLGTIFEDDLKLQINRTINWINSFDKKNIVKELINERLSKNITLTLFEQKILDHYNNWEYTKIAARGKGIMF